uniref:Sushi domain-containing protein n=1 Tax=Jaculus jaculus TaxID=51337 RepID=A0A8C5KGN0_JACJA
AGDRAMARARPSALPPGLLLLLLLLLALLCPATRGDCGQPPEVINAKPILQGQTSFPEKSIVTYKCDNGFMKIPGQPDSTICLSTGEWSEILEFCNRSCNVPPRLSFASLKPVYGRQNYFPVGSIVEYECRPGYLRDPSLSRKVTCLQSLQWSKPAEFCKSEYNFKSNLGHLIFIFYSLTNFTYRLVGSDSSFCSVIENTVGWSDPLPECIEIFCPKPPKIDNGIIQDERENYGYRQSITYVCDKGFTLVGKSSIYCDMNDDQGEWSDQPPQCIGNDPRVRIPSTLQKPSTINTSIPPTPQKPSTGNIPATEIPPTPQKPSKYLHGVQRFTSAHITATSHVPVTKTTTRFHSTRTATERKEISTSDLFYDCLTVLTILC